MAPISQNTKNTPTQHFGPNSLSKDRIVSIWWSFEAPLRTPKIATNIFEFTQKFYHVQLGIESGVEL
jgi:hypothetical protein